MRLPINIPVFRCSDQVNCEGIHSQGSQGTVALDRTSLRAPNSPLGVSL